MAGIYASPHFRPTERWFEFLYFPRRGLRYLGLCDAMKDWRDWMLSVGLSEAQADALVSRGYCWCVYFMETLFHMKRRGKVV